ncbi:MAG TPA: orotidine-5'-phosphate decarboxylase [Ilumatobacteraceae bacterium]|nr:orotidine-5'-phosphate decarboxylase [Ilumatobacteraceae bacterium]
MGFHDKLRGAWQMSQSMLCVGLDPDPALMPDPFRGSPEATYQFCKTIVDATAASVCAFKPQFAYFAAQAAEPQLERLCSHIRDAHPHVLLILDAKRGDIGPTAEQYAREAFVRYGADVVTVNPYLGTDSIEPYLNYRDRGVFALCRTSNPGSGDFQSLELDGQPLFAHVARRAVDVWSKLGDCGLVVGATYPGELGTVRSIVGDMPLLVPGIGVQGGDIEATVAAGRTADGFGMVINSSRAILFASNGTDFADAAARQATATRDAIRRCAALDQQVSASTEMMPGATRN